MAVKVKQHSRVKTKGVKAHTRKGLESKAGAGREMAAKAGRKLWEKKLSQNAKVTRGLGAYDSGGSLNSVINTRGETMGAHSDTLRQRRINQGDARRSGQGNRRMRKHMASKK